MTAGPAGDDDGDVVEASGDRNSTVWVIPVHPTRPQRVVLGFAPVYTAGLDLLLAACRILEQEVLDVGLGPSERRDDLSMLGTKHDEGLALDEYVVGSQVRHHAETVLRMSNGLSAA